MATTKSAELRPIDSKSFSDFENYISEISNEDQALIVGGGGGVIVKVTRGNTLWGLANYWCGNGNKWPQIYRANKGTIGSNPDLIKPGQRLYIPCV